MCECQICYKGYKLTVKEITSRCDLGPDCFPTVSLRVKNEPNPNRTVHRVIRNNKPSMEGIQYPFQFIATCSRRYFFPNKMIVRIFSVSVLANRPSTHSRSRYFRFLTTSSGMIWPLFVLGLFLSKCLPVLLIRVTGTVDIVVCTFLPPPFKGSIKFDFEGATGALQK